MVATVSAARFGSILTPWLPVNSGWPPHPIDIHGGSASRNEIFRCRDSALKRAASGPTDWIRRKSATRNAANRGWMSRISGYLKMTRLRGGRDSCHTNKPQQSLAQKCGRLGRFEAKCVFSLPPSPTVESESDYQIVSFKTYFRNKRCVLRTTKINGDFDAL
jgi:hypothetical protein